MSLMSKTSSGRQDNDFGLGEPSDGLDQGHDIGDVSTSGRCDNDFSFMDSQCDLDKALYAVDVIERTFSRSNRRIEMVGADEAVILARLLKLTVKKRPVSRGAIVEAFTGSGKVGTIPTSTILACISNSARMGLIETVEITRPNKISGRPVQTIKPSENGRLFLEKLAELTIILESSIVSHKSQQLLN